MSASISRRNRPLALITAASWLAWTGGTANAQEQSDGTIVVTGQRSGESGASKTEVPLTDIPQAVTGISRGDMDARGVDTIAEAVRYSPGVAADYYGPDGRGFEWIQLRGFSTFDSTYRDGMRLFNYGFSEAYGLEAVEIVRGPSSVLYGQAPPGGLVNSVSKLPPSDTQGEVELALGTRNHVQGAFDVGGPLTEGGALSGRLVGLARDADLQFEYPDGSAVLNNRRYIAAALTWRIGENTRLNLLGDYLEQEGGFGWYAITPTGEPTRVMLTDHGWDADYIYAWDAGYLFEHDFSANLKFRSRLRYTLFDDDGRYLSDAGFNTPAEPTLLDRTTQRWYSRSEAWTSDNMLEGRFEALGAQHLIIAGVDYSTGDILNIENTGFAPPLDVAAPVYGKPIDFPPVVDWDETVAFEQLGFYLQDQVKWDRWILTAGLRHDHATSLGEERISATTTDVDEEALTGRIGLGYSMPSGLTPYVSYSQSFLPNLGTDASGAPFEPTRGEQIEFGVKYQTRSGFLVTATAFRLEQQNVLTDDLDNPGFSVARGAARSEGIELEARGDFTTALHIEASYTYNPVEITESNAGDTGNRLPLLPEHAASLWLDYEVESGPLANLTIGGGVRYVGETYADTTNMRENPALAVVDLAASYDLGSWRLSLDAENLFDETILINDGFSYFYETERRTVTLATRYKW